MHGSHLREITPIHDLFWFETIDGVDPNHSRALSPLSRFPNFTCDFVTSSQAIPVNQPPTYIYIVPACQVRVFSPPDKPGSVSEYLEYTELFSLGHHSNTIS
jgi:hypothetical protein